MAGIFGAHLLEITMYAGTYSGLEHVLGVGEIAGTRGHTFTDYFYYSAVMYTSLGLGDLVPQGHLRILSAIESLNGLLLIGWSTSFTFLAMRRYWPLDPPPVQRTGD